jgi:hypothetical protein
MLEKNEIIMSKRFYSQNERWITTLRISIEAGTGSRAFSVGAGAGKKIRNSKNRDPCKN